jgi:hypothetical protein
MSDKRARRLPDEALAYAEQSLLNLVLGGAQVISADGVNLTVSLLAQANRINQQFDQALRKSAPAKRTPRKASSPAGPPRSKKPATTKS